MQLVRINRGHTNATTQIEAGQDKSDAHERRTLSMRSVNGSPAVSSGHAGGRSLSPEKNTPGILRWRYRPGSTRTIPVEAARSGTDGAPGPRACDLSRWPPKQSSGNRATGANRV